METQDYERGNVTAQPPDPLLPTEGLAPCPFGCPDSTVHLQGVTETIKVLSVYHDSYKCPAQGWSSVERWNHRVYPSFGGVGGCPEVAFWDGSKLLLPQFTVTPNMEAATPVEIHPAGSRALMHTLSELNKDACETDTEIRELCKSVLTEHEVEGDSFGVPPLFNVVELLVSRYRALLAAQPRVTLEKIESDLAVYTPVIDHWDKYPMADAEGNIVPDMENVEFIRLDELRALFHPTQPQEKAT